MKKSFFTKAVMLIGCLLMANFAWAETEVVKSWDLAAIGKANADKTAFTTFCDGTIKAGSTECNLGTGVIDGLFAQGGGSWLFRSAGSLYQGNGGGRIFGINNLKAGDVVTITTNGDYFSGITNAESTFADNTYTWTVTADGMVYGSFARYNYIYKVTVEREKSNKPYAPTGKITAVNGTSRTITLATETEGCSIYYTTDGTEPTTESTLYTEAGVVISQTTTIKAIAVAEGVASDVYTAEFEAGTDVKLNAPSCYISNMKLVEGAYFPTYSVTVDNSNVLCKPAATLVATFNGFAVEMPYDVTEAGSLEVYVTADGYADSDVVVIEVTPYSKALSYNFKGMAEDEFSNTAVWDGPEAGPLGNWGSRGDMDDETVHYTLKEGNNATAFPGLTINPQVKGSDTVYPAVYVGFGLIFPSTITNYGQVIATDAAEGTVICVTTAGGYGKNVSTWYTGATADIYRVDTALEKCVVYVPDPSIPIEDFNSLCDAPEGITVKVTMPTTVVLAEENFTLLYDGVSYYGAQIIGTEVAVGDIIAAGWNAQVTAYGLFTEEAVKVSGKAESLPAPTPVDGENLLNDVTAWGYQTLEGLYIAEDLTEDDAMVEAEFVNYEQAVNLYNILGKSAQAGTYNVTGVWYALPQVALSDEEAEESGEPGTGDGSDEDNIGLDAANWVFIPVSFEIAPEKIGNFTALVDFPEGANVTIDMPTTVVLTEEAFTLLYDGESYYGAQILGTELTAGDIIAAGWNAQLTAYGLFCEEAVEVSGKAETLPAPTPVAGEDVLNSVAAWGYQTLEGLYIAEDLTEDDAMVEAEFVNYDQAVNLYNILGKSAQAGTYNVTGVWYELPKVAAADEEETEEPGTGDGSDNDNIGFNGTEWVFIPVSFEIAPEKIGNFTALVDFPEGANVTINMPTTVVLAEEAFTLLYDGESYYGAQISGTEVAAGDIIAAGWNAQLTAYGLFTEDAVEISGKAESLPAPTPVDGENVLNAVAAWDYQTLEGLFLFDGLAEDDAMVEAEFVIGGQAVNLYNILGKSAQAGNYNVTGVWYALPQVALSDEETEESGEPGTGDGSDEDNIGLDAENWVFIPVSFELIPEQIYDFNALCDFPEESNVVIATDATVVYSSESFTLLYDGESYFGAMFGQELNAGDVVAGGWDAILMMHMLVAMDTVEVSGNAEVPAPMEVDEEMLFPSMMVDYNYVKLLGVEIDEFDEDDMAIGYVGEEPVAILNIAECAVPSEFEAGKYDVVGCWFDMSSIMAYDDDDYNVEPQKAVVLVPFELIKDASGIIGIENEANGSVVYYNLNGVKVAEPAAGSVVIRIVNGKAVKMIKK